MLFIVYLAAIVGCIQIPFIGKNQDASVMSGYQVGILKFYDDAPAQFSLSNIYAINTPTKFLYASEIVADKLPFELNSAGPYDINYMSKLKHVTVTDVSNKMSTMVITNTETKKVVSVMGVGDQFACTIFNLTAAAANDEKPLLDEKPSYGFVGTKFIKIVKEGLNEHHLTILKTFGNVVDGNYSSYELTDAFDGRNVGKFASAATSLYKLHNLFVIEETSTVPIEQVEAKFNLPEEVLSECEIE